MFTKHLEPLFFTYLKDKTYAVRDVGVKKLKVSVDLEIKFILILIRKKIILL